jgi:glycosyltransferase involved in cell wall biosynthesis
LKPVVSVLITTYKAIDHLHCCLDSLLRSEMCAEVEVVVYGDGGGPESREALLAWRKRCEREGVVHHIFYEEKNKGICGALNGAAGLATGKWLFVVNDDMVFPKSWYLTAKEFLVTGKVISVRCAEPELPRRSVASCFLPLNLGLDPLNFDFAQLDELAFHQAQHPLFEKGANYPFFVERAHFLSIGGADERFPGPYHDPDLYVRFQLAGLEMIRAQHLVLYHFSGVSLRFGQQSLDELQKANRKSYNWIRKENQARIAFIKKWGVKPKAKFGEVPKVTVQRVWCGVEEPWQAKTLYWLLLSWEKVRCLWRECWHR